MQIKDIEFYPFRKRDKVHTCKLKTKKAACDLEISHFMNVLYLHLVNECANINELVTCGFTKLIQYTCSTSGFLAIIKKGEENSIQFSYHCVYTPEHGVTFKSIINDTSACMISPKEPSLLTRGIHQKRIIVSNKMSTDPRAQNLPPTHSKIDTFLLLPLIVDDKIIGQIGLSNSKKYTRSLIERIIPFQQFFSIFTHLWSERKLSVTRELDIKHEVVTLKDSFIATMSHEIRTPLNGIVGMTRLLAEADNLNEKQQKYVHILTECSVQLMELVNDILDYSKMSSGNITFINSPFNLRNCITSTIEILQPRAADKGLSIKTDIPSDLPENVTGDSRRLKQVLFNLVTNAIKFTEKGFVKVSARFECVTNLASRVNSKRVYFTVTDTGIGISNLNQGKIFEVFTKLSADDKFYTNTSPGAGMGLAISKYIVQAMGGTISVRSDGTSGSTFEFNVILDDETDIQALLKLHQQELRDKVALVVDDTEDNRIFISDALYSWGIKSHVYSSGREALNFLHKQPRIDFAVIDICMPQMSGIELVQSMREHGFKAPVIGLSSIGEDVIGREWFDRFITKPTSKSTLFNIILQSIMQSSQIDSPRTFEKVSSDTSLGVGMNILVAEDDYYNQIVIKELLTTLGYSLVTVVNNGKAAVDATRNKKYHLCLMDVKMPVMDGLEATRIIKKHVHPPVIIGVSASVLDIDKNKCFSAGMDGYIPKPIQKEQLESVLSGLDFRRSASGKNDF